MTRQEHDRKYYLANREKVKARSKARREALKHTPEYKAKKRDLQRKWQAKNRSKCTAYAMKYFAKKLQATPALTDDEQWMIQEIYDLCSERTEVTGVSHHVDHIVPLQGENVSGLHVPWNLQVLTAHDNISKSNSWEVS
jgi:5-methylcytosine-specific restriction endonuclease McrA